MTENDKALKYLSISQKAGYLVTGEENTGSAVRTGKVRILLVASDASANAERRAAGYGQDRSFPLVKLPFTKAEIASAAGKTGCSMAAMTDLGLAKSFAEALEEQYPGKFTDVRDYLAARYKRAVERKRAPSSVSRNRGKHKGGLTGKGKGGTGI